MPGGFWETRKNDLQAVLTRDPAARSVFEILFCYPGYKALRRHRLAHALWKRGFYFAARFLSSNMTRKTGVDIHPGAVIGQGVFIDHGHGVVIGETAVIGDEVTIYQGVTLGGTGKDHGKRHPTIGSRVVIGAGAKVLGPFTVGDDSKIGAGSIVLREIPPGSTVVGNPGRVVRQNGVKPVIDLDQVHLPDPVKEAFDALRERVESLEGCITHIRENGCSSCHDVGESDCAILNCEKKLAEL